MKKNTSDSPANARSLVTKQKGQHLQILLPHFRGKLRFEDVLQAVREVNAEQRKKRS